MRASEATVMFRRCFSFCCFFVGELSCRTLRHTETELSGYDHNHQEKTGCLFDFPASLRETTVIPIPKLGKDAAEPGDCRPIALTSCVCKTFEHLANDRLVWFLKTNGVLTEFQSGFRKQRSTTDSLVWLESFIRKAFLRCEHVVSVSFDLEQAYDTTRKHGILRDLHSANLRGRLPQLISKFVLDRQFRMRVGSCLSVA
jgi:Reverse transcriptase (RNA-dependent DNA polymerase)